LQESKILRRIQTYLKIDERKEEKETASSAGEEKFLDQTENTNYPKANLLFEGGL